MTANLESAERPSGSEAMAQPNAVIIDDDPGSKALIAGFPAPTLLVQPLRETPRPPNAGQWGGQDPVDRTREEGNLMKFLSGLTAKGNPCWWLYNADGKPIARSGQTFGTLAFAQHAALDFKANAARARYEIYKDEGGSWRWRAVHLKYQSAVSEDGYSRPSRARHAARHVARTAALATGP